MDEIILFDIIINLMRLNGFNCDFNEINIYFG